MHTFITAPHPRHNEQKRNEEAPLLPPFSVCATLVWLHVLMVVMVSCWWSKCDVVALSHTCTGTRIQSTAGL